MAKGQQNKKADGKKGKGVGMTAPPPGPKLTKQEKNEAKKAGLRPKQYASILQREGMDLQLGDYAQGMMPGIEASYSQPFDWEGLPDWQQGPDWESLPSAPVQGDYNNWREEQLNQSMTEFDAQMQPQFEKDQERFRQQMYNRGIPEGSEQYNRLQDEMLQAQSKARSSYLQQAREGASADAQQFFNIGSQARQGAIGEGLQRYGFGAQQRGDQLNEQMMMRNLPLNEYNQLMAARSPYDIQNLGYSQQRALADQNFGYQQQLARMGGGGGGGGAAPPAWAKAGFSSFQDMAAWEDVRSRANQMFAWQNDPRYQTGSGPDPWASFGGQLGGIIAGSIIGGGILK